MSERRRKNWLDLPLLRRVLVYVRPYRRRFVFTALLTIVLAFLSPIRPMLIQYTIDEAVAHVNGQLLMQMSIVLVGFLCVEATMQFFESYLASWLGQHVIRDMRAVVFRKIMGFRMKYFDKTPIGTLVTRAVSDIETIAEVFSQSILVMMGDILKLLVIIAVMFYTDWRLALISLSTIPLLLIATQIFKNAIKSAYQQVRTQVSKLNTFVQEHITGMSVVQIFNREEEEMKRFSSINADHRRAHIQSVWAYSIFFPVVEILSASSIALLVWWGGRGVVEGSFTIGNLVAFILYIHMLFRPIRQLADRFNTLQMGMVSAERVFKVLDTEEQVRDEGTFQGELIGDLQFDAVWFSYADQVTEEAEWVLREVSFEVKQGQTLAIVGATGAGKSSIVNILARFYEFQKGEISIGGRSVRAFQLAALRQRIGVVLQDVFLFSGSIMNNIRLYDESISEEQVKEAAKAVGAHDFIMRLPGGYDYDVRERGAVLSTGQRQLIAFIRSYVYDPQILVLDEATSSIDPETEELIQYATKKLCENRTAIIIAHRLTTIQQAHSILVLDQGRVVEQGTHDDLLQQDGQYKHLHDLQLYATP